MSVTLEWPDIALRLALAVVAGFLIGINRGERGKPAGLRTTILVCLAAAVSMVLTNLLITTRGRPSDSFVQYDIMRIPLGVLSGIGFIGAGTILKKGDLVVGVTTAATVWYVTMIGLCLGAGQIGLGITSLVLGMVILWGLGWVEDLIHQDRRGTVVITSDRATTTGLSESQIRAVILECGCTITSCDVRLGPLGTEEMVRCEVQYRARRHDSQPPEFLKQIAGQPGVGGVNWRG